MNKKNLEQLMLLRRELVLMFESRKDYKNNNQALMKEMDHVKALSTVIKSLDDILRDHVKFS
mgnify:CR=1 FL=1